MADSTSPKSLTQVATELGLQSPGATMGLSSALITTQTQDEADYERMLENLCQLTGQPRATIATYVDRYVAQWISRPEPAPQWPEVWLRIMQKVTSGEPIDWYGAKPDVPIFR